MNQKQRKAKLKRANQHRLMAKSPEYRANWEQRQDKWVEQMKANGRLIEVNDDDFDFWGEPKPKRNGWNMAVIVLLTVFIGLPLVTCGIAILIG